LMSVTTSESASSVRKSTRPYKSGTPSING
jgi:hypothetical protein